MSNALLRDLAMAKAAFQLRAIKAVMCISARSKTDQEPNQRSRRMSDRDIDGLVKRLEASRAVWTNENGRAESRPSDLEMEAAAAIRELQAEWGGLKAENRTIFECLDANWTSHQQMIAQRTRAEAAEAERDRLRDALSGSVDALTHAQEGLNAAADDQQDKHGNVMGAAALRALAMLLDISCARSRAALATPPKSGT